MLLFGMMIIVGVLAETGIFEFMAVKAKSIFLITRRSFSTSDVQTLGRQHMATGHLAVPVRRSGVRFLGTCDPTPQYGSSYVTTVGQRDNHSAAGSSDYTVGVLIQSHLSVTCVLQQDVQGHRVRPQACASC